jgi:hypothetical protein
MEAAGPTVATWYPSAVPDVAQPRTLKVFIASPGDVIEERDALARLIRDINDVLAFLAQEKRLTLELVRYETHAYPDLGMPQDVINRQIPVDYDIFVGVMWKRVGTSTANAPSGTIEEFHRAVARRKTSHLPRIMFYFCDEKIAIPGPDEIAQITEVIKFREELSRLGLTETYPAHAAFTEHVRGGLLRAMRDILQEESRATSNLSIAKSLDTVDPAAQTALLALADEYEKIRREMPSSSVRTRRMTAVFSQMKAHAAGARSLLDQFMQSESAGRRLAAIAILQMFPDPDHLQWLAGRLQNPDVEQPFVGYMAAVALLEAVRALPASAQTTLKAALHQAQEFAEGLPTDSNRLDVLKVALQEFERRFGKRSAKISKSPSTAKKKKTAKASL